MKTGFDHAAGDIWGIDPRTRSLWNSWLRAATATRSAPPPRQGVTLVHFTALPGLSLFDHLPVSSCLIDCDKTMHRTYPTKCA